ncbi:hypothetical protein ARMGADRAFT_797293 [Armillaria gallica]|uniref:Secreted protein n=1 Tax=Armillaria gallica TaxID=47427 RepID=A0A2H3DJF1_ARMGA|nr:hypothetical protein ARMGADRAFT_797293 [Armillaria gallica]
MKHQRVFTLLTLKLLLDAKLVALMTIDYSFRAGHKLYNSPRQARYNDWNLGEDKPSQNAEISEHSTSRRSFLIQRVGVIFRWVVVCAGYHIQILHIGKREKIVWDSRNVCHWERVWWWRDTEPRIRTSTNCHSSSPSEDPRSEG